MYDNNVLNSGANMADIVAETNLQRRAAALRGHIDSLIAQRSEISVRLGSQKRRMAQGDYSHAMAIKGNEARIKELTDQIDTANARFEREYTGNAPGDFLEEGATKPAPKGGRGDGAKKGQ